MIISRTPFRISLFGGSTDIESFYSKHESLVIGFAINKYVYIALRYTPHIVNYRTLVQYSKTEMVDDNSLIRHDGARGTLEFMGIKDGVEIANLLDLPARTGTGSSSSYVVGLLNALCQLKYGEGCKKTELARNAIEIERHLLKEPGGIQDQIWAAHAGVGSIRINKEGEYRVRPLPVCNEFLNEFNQSMVLFYTGDQRNSFQISRSHDNQDAEPKKKLIKQLAEEAMKAFEHENITEIGRLLDESWHQKRQTSSLISTNKIDDIYNSAKRHGAIGSKLLGSGGGGFILCITEDRHKLLRNMDLNHVEFTWDYEGSKVILS